MPNTLRSRISVMADGCINAFHFVGGNTGADTRAADQNPPLSFPALNGTPYLLREVREIHRFRAIRAQINGFVTRLTHSPQDGFLERESRVIKPNGDFHDTPP